MKKAAVISVFIALLSLASCGRGGYDPREDSTVYDTHLYADGCIFFDGSESLEMELCDMPEKSYPVCPNPLHGLWEPDCPYDGVIWSTLTVDAEGRGYPLIYLFSEGPQYKYTDGEFVKIPQSDHQRIRVKEVDVTTGEVRLIATTELVKVTNSFCYRGKIYMGATGGPNGYIATIGYTDIETGETSYLQADVGERLLGAYDGRIYFISDRGMISSASTVLDDVREEFDCGISAVVRPTSDVPLSYMSGSIIYFERDIRPPEGVDDPYTRVSDVYALDLSDIKSGAVKVAENVYQFYSADGNLYYTVYDLEDLGSVSGGGDEFENYCYDGGTLHMYNPETGKTKECCSDIGMCFIKIYEIADGKIFFYGKRYRDFEEEQMKNSVEYEMVMYDTGTGALTVFNMGGLR